MEVGVGAGADLGKVLRLGGGGACSSVSVSRLVLCRRRRTRGTARAAVVTASYFRGRGIVIVRLYRPGEGIEKRTRATGTHLGISFFSLVLSFVRFSLDSVMVRMYI